MRPARRRRLKATAVSLSLLMSIVAMPVAAQGTGPAAYECDRAIMADLLLKRSEINYRLYAGLIDDTEASAALSAEVAPTLGVLQERWRPTGRLADMEMEAMSLRADEYEALSARYGGGRASGLEGAWVAVRNFLGGIWQYLIFGPLALIALIGVLRVLAAGQKRRTPPPVSDNFGTARYAAVRTEMPHWSYAHQGVFFGKSSDPDMKAVPLAEQPGAPILSTPEHHTLIVARTRTGKGTRVIVPTLLRYAGSAIVIDPKGENAAVTARVRAGMICDAVHIINPWGELAATFADRDLPAATFNPLDVLVRDDPNAVAVAQALAGAICPSSPNDKDRYWQGSAANVLAAVLLWITDQPGESKTLARAREIVSMSRKDFTDNFLVKMAASSAFGGAIKEMVSPYLDLAQETYSGIMANLSENTKFLSDPQVKAATARSTFDMADLIRQSVTVYLVIPPDRIDTQRTWLRLMTTAAMHTFKRFPLEERPPHRCMILMDEFPALGRIEDMPRDIATMSGYGIDFTLIVQGLDQLKDLYGAAAGTILSNCAYKWFCNVNDLESARYLSDTLGKATVRTIGQTEGENEGPGGAGKSEGIAYGETGRPLLMPDEVLALGRDVAILVNPDDRPHYLRPVDYWQLPDAFENVAAQYPQMYWKPPLVFDDNPYHRKGVA